MTLDMFDINNHRGHIRVTLFSI